MSDRRLVYLAAFLRAFATALAGVLIGLYLARLDLGPAAIGTVVSAGLAGAATATLVVTLAGDRLGRRRTLILLALLSAAGGVVVALARDPLVIAAAAFIGMVNGMGRDRGASLVLEQALLPATATDATRTRAFAVYNVLQDAGHALGSLAAILPKGLAAAGASQVGAARTTMLVYAALCLAPAIFYARLSPTVETVRGARVRLSPQSRRLIARISALFAIDSLGGGFLTTALLAYFFHERFGVDVGSIAPLFFAARLANAGSHLAAAWLARRIGLVNTMVLTHIPSSLLLVTVAFAPSFPIAAVLFLLREGLVEMDVPTRQSYVMAVVSPEERTIASGTTALVRMAAWAIAPSFAGIFMSGTSLLLPLIIGAGLKISYDFLLWRAFRNVRPPEERGG